MIMGLYMLVHLFYICCFNSHEPEHLWEIPNDRNLGGISCLSHHDMTGDKFNDLLVGREDGTIEVYSYDSTDPTLRFSQVCVM